MKQTVKHPFLPIYNENSRVLILGSFPSVKSREQLFFYGHPQNRFWKVLSAIFECPLPETITQKTEMLLSHQVALWDVIARCDIKGSADASIENVVVNDLSIIVNHAPIEHIYCNGNKAFELYQRYIEPQLQKAAVCLPSTSSANAAWSLDRLIAAWHQLI